MKMKSWDLTLSKVVLDNEFEKFRQFIPAGDSLNERRESLILWLLINTGIRVSELCGLRVKDTPAVLGSLVIEVHRGKGDKSRNIPISEKFAVDIEDYIRNIRPATLPQRFAKQSLDGWLFFDFRGKKFTRQQIYRLVRRISKKAGILKAISPHSFRHRFATRTLDKNGQNLCAVKAMLGHSSISTTEKYLHLSGMLNRGVGEMLDQKYPEVT
jgi:integrase/recombinase XerD